MMKINFALGKAGVALIFGIQAAGCAEAGSDPAIIKAVAPDTSYVMPNPSGDLLVTEFTPVSNPDFTCVHTLYRHGGLNNGAISCFPKAAP